MKTKKQRIIKNTFSYLLAFTLFICANFGLISVLMPDYVSYAANTTNPNEITISNSNFDSNTSNNYPFSPDNFTPSLDEDNAGVEAGVINLEADDYKDIYTQNPMSDDPYVLMIKAKMLAVILVTQPMKRLRLTNHLTTCSLLTFTLITTTAS